jgi:hypothetical protein
MPQRRVIVVTSGAGAAAKTITVQTIQRNVLKRYAPASVRFDDAQPEPIDAIHSGDQLRARGAKNADDTEIAAEEVVTGSFRNISGTILSLDKATSTLILKDLTTKKPVTIHITADVQMRRLPGYDGADAGGAAERRGRDWRLQRRTERIRRWSGLPARRWRLGTMERRRRSRPRPWRRRHAADA